LRDINEVLENYVDLDPPDRKLTAYFALSSWFSDLLHVVPYLWIVGPIGFGKTTLVRLLSVLCRRGILVGDISSAGLYSVSDSLHPTVLLDDFDYGLDSRTRDLLRLLRNGSTAGLRVIRAARAYQLFGPKVISSRQGPNDAALKSRGLVVVAPPFSRVLSVLSNDALEEVQHRLQPNLLRFRLENYLRLTHHEYTISASSLTPRIKDIVRALALPLMGDVEFERELLEIVEPHNMEATVEHHSEPEWFVMLALLANVHNRLEGVDMLTVMKVKEDVESLLKQASEPHQLTARKVGAILKSLGFRTKKLGSWGRGLRFSRDLILAVHVKAKRLGICVGDLRPPAPFKESGPATYCRDCYEQGLLYDNDGKELPYVEAEEFLPVPQNIDPFERS